MDPNLKLNSFDGEFLDDPSMYTKLIGRLMYRTICRLDKFCSHQTCSIYVQTLSSSLGTVHHLLRYLKNAPWLGVLFPSKSKFTLTAYVDADCGSSLGSGRSISGYFMFIGEVVVTWTSKKQPTVSTSSAETEYRALSNVASEITWLTTLLKFFEIQVPPTMVLCDSMAGIHISTNPTFHERSKQVEIDFHFVRERVNSGLLKLLHVLTHHQQAGPLTMPVTETQFHNLMTKWSILDIFPPT